MKNYIQAPEHTKLPYNKYAEWSSADRVPIEKIKVDSRLFSYPNAVDDELVKNIIENFEIDLWTPIVINEDLFLIDGQHRLKAAMSMGLKYIDVIVQHVENYSYFYGKPVKSIS